MSPVRAAAGKKAAPAWDDTRLVKECLHRNEEAWSLLIDKYRALIYSIPVRYGLPPHEAADVFQATCAELLVRLPELREPRNDGFRVVWPTMIAAKHRGLKEPLAQCPIRERRNRGLLRRVL